MVWPLTPDGANLHSAPKPMPGISEDPQKVSLGDVLAARTGEQQPTGVFLFLS